MSAELFKLSLNRHEATHLCKVLRRKNGFKPKTTIFQPDHLKVTNILIVVPPKIDKPNPFKLLLCLQTVSRDDFYYFDNNYKL